MAGANVYSKLNINQKRVTSKHKNSNVSIERKDAKQNSNLEIGRKAPKQKNATEVINPVKPVSKETYELVERADRKKPEVFNADAVCYRVPMQTNVNWETERQAYKIKNESSKLK